MSEQKVDRILLACGSVLAPLATGIIYGATSSAKSSNQLSMAKMPGCPNE